LTQSFLQCPKESRRRSQYTADCPQCDVIGKDVFAIAMRYQHHKQHGCQQHRTRYPNRIDQEEDRRRYHGQAEADGTLQRRADRGQNKREADFSGRDGQGGQ
jgi:hypothetical protein